VNPNPDSIIEYALNLETSIWCAC